VPRRALLLVPALALTASITACAGSDPAPETAPPATRPSSPAASLAPSPTPSPKSDALVVEIDYAGGKVTGAEQRVPVKLGQQVVLRFTSDVTEEIHVHGYDLYADLVPGQPAEIAFKATLPGSWEVELHDAGKPLYQLRVS
jgi:hypothetical protein